jgi:hypothetical protein
MEEFLTGAILSGIAYDIIKCGTMLTVDNLKERLKNWLIDDAVLLTMSNELNKLELTDEMSEKSIERKINSSSELQTLLENIKPITESNVIIQHHSGSGDNVGGNKIIN